MAKIRVISIIAVLITVLCLASCKDNKSEGAASQGNSDNQASAVSSRDVEEDKILGVDDADETVETDEAYSNSQTEGSSENQATVDTSSAQSSDAQMSSTDTTVGELGDNVVNFSDLLG